MTDDNRRTPEGDSFAALAELRRQLEAQKLELAEAKAQILTDRASLAVTSAFEREATYPKARGLGIRTVLAEIKNLRMDGDTLIGSRGELEGAPIDAIVRAFLNDDENEVFRGIEDGTDGTADAANQQPTPKPVAGRTAEGIALPRGPLGIAHAGEKLIDLPTETLLQMADRDRTVQAPTPYKKPKGKELHELTDRELLLLAESHPKRAS